MERETEIEPAPLCLGIKSTLPQTVSGRFRVSVGTVLEQQPQSLEQSVYLLDRLTYRDGEVTEARDPEFTVGFPKPGSASHVAASMRSLLVAYSHRAIQAVNGMNSEIHEDTPWNALSSGLIVQSEISRCHHARVCGSPYFWRKLAPKRFLL